jgi:glycosyltransferase involved in cell wall biosynthesis
MNHDAIANDIVRKVRALRETPGWEVTVFAGYNERQDIASVWVPQVADLLIEPGFVNADVIVYHFGIYYPQFGAILLGNGRAKQAVVFHNVTPLELAPPSAKRTIEKSFEQLQYLHEADAVWADSRENFETAVAHGIDAAKIAIQPLAVDRPARQGVRKPGGDAVQVVFVGRIVPSKGVHDLIEAVALLDRTTPVRVKVVGNLESADEKFVGQLRARVEALGLESSVEFTGGIPDDERDALLASSHILAMPSYHEGFCVPVVEAMRAGLLPVVYSAANLRYIADGLCISAPAGDVPAFAAALSKAVTAIDAIRRDPSQAKLRVDRGEMGVDEFERAVAAHLDNFEPENTARSLRALVEKLVAA